MSQKSLIHYFLTLQIVLLIGLVLFSSHVASIPIDQNGRFFQVAISDTNTIFQPFIVENQESWKISQVGLDVFHENETLLLIGGEIREYMDDESIQKYDRAKAFLSSQDQDFQQIWNISWVISPWGNLHDFFQDEEGNIYSVETSSDEFCSSNAFFHQYYYTNNLHLIIRKWNSHHQQEWEWHSENISTGNLDFENFYQVRLHPFGNQVILSVNWNSSSTLFCFDKNGESIWNRTQTLSTEIHVFPISRKIGIEYYDHLEILGENGNKIQDLKWNSGFTKFIEYSSAIFGYSFNFSSFSNQLTDNITLFSINSDFSQIQTKVWQLHNFSIHFGTNIVCVEDSEFAIVLSSDLGSINENRLICWNENLSITQEQSNSVSLFLNKLQINQGILYSFEHPLKIGLTMGVLKWSLPENTSIGLTYQVPSIIERKSYPFVSNPWGILFLVILGSIFIHTIQNGILKMNKPNKESIDSKKEIQIRKEKGIKTMDFSPSEASIFTIATISGFIIINFKPTSAQISQSSILFFYMMVFLTYLIQIIVKAHHNKERITEYEVTENQFSKSGKVLFYGGILYLLILLWRLDLMQISILESIQKDNQYILSFTLVMAIIEEFFFRRTLLQYFSKITNQKKMIFGIIIQALIWMGCHIQYWNDPLQLTIVFILGLYFGYLFYFTQDIKKILLIHLGNNFLGILTKF